MVDLNWFHASVVLLIFVSTYVGIVRNSFDKTLAAVLGAVASAVALDFMGVGSEEDLLHNEDLQIIGLIFGTLIVVDICQDAGVFHFLSVKILKLSHGNPKLLLRYFGILTLVLSAFVNNISAMMIVGSLTIIACERLELDPKPYIVVELSMTTIGGIVTLISSVPNIIISQLFGISFITFFLIGAPWAVITMVVNFAIFEWIYRNDIPELTNPKEMLDRVNEFDEWSAVKDREIFYRSVIVLTLTIMGFIFSNQLNLSLSLIAVAGGIVGVLVSGKNLDEVMAKLDWSLIAFFLGLFVLIAALKEVQLLKALAELLAGILPKNGIIAGGIILWIVAVISGIVDNIVVAAAFGPVLLEVAQNSPSLSADLIAWATIFGANFGGGFTPIGAPSGVVGLAILKRKTGKPMGWVEFFETQGLATIVRIILTMAYLWFLGVVLF